MGVGLTIPSWNDLLPHLITLSVTGAIEFISVFDWTGDLDNFFEYGVMYFAREGWDLEEKIYRVYARRISYGWKSAIWYILGY